MKEHFLEISINSSFITHFSLNFSAEAYDALDPTGNITIKWDIMSWTPDGYVVSRMKCVIVVLFLVPIFTLVLEEIYFLLQLLSQI